jgi:hypothetical protein
MELSPEERQRIYAEEKLRLEAQSAIRSVTSGHLIATHSRLRRL